MSTTQDEIRYERPANITPEQWEDIKAATVDYLDAEVEEVTGRCRTYAWCVDAGTEDHQSHHSSAVVDVVTAPATGEPRTWCWLVQSRHGSNDEPVHVVFEGEGPGGSWCFDMRVGRAATVLALAEDYEARSKLWDLLKSAEGLS